MIYTKKILGLVFPILLLSLNVWSLGDMYAGFSMGSVTMDETIGTTLHRDSSSFVDFGFDLGARFGVDLGAITLGGVADLSWEGNAIDKKINGVTNNGWVRVERWILSTGGYAGVNLFGTFRLYGEYYPVSNSSVTYASGSPFSTVTSTTGDGYGVGFQFDAARFRMTVLFRRLITKSFNSAPSGTTLGNLVSEGGTTQFGFTF